MVNEVIFLAAGEGKRLRPHTQFVPKGMVKLNNISLIERNMAEWKKLGACSFYFITGYKSEIIEALGTGFVRNAEYEQTNMVWSLACGLDYIRSLSSQHIFVCYADIIVHQSRLKKLIDANGSFCVHVDLDWRDLWSMRMDDYFDDVETLLHDGKKIIALGKKASSEKEVQGQYIGLMRYDRVLLIELLENYLKWVTSARSDEEIKVRKNIFMTDFIQDYIDFEGEVTPVFINGGWLEVDTVNDLNIYERHGHDAPFLLGLAD